jgi:nicotinate phosphoribosyltransferase
MIIQSLLDTDLYKFTMMQVVLHHFPGAQVEYKFKCRTAGVDLRPDLPAIEAEITRLCSLRFRDDELIYLRGLIFMKSDFGDFLALFHFSEKYGRVAPGEKPGEIDITVKARGCTRSCTDPAACHRLRALPPATQSSPTGRGPQALKAKIEVARRSSRSSASASPTSARAALLARLAGGSAADLQAGGAAALRRHVQRLVRDAQAMTPLGTMAHEYMQARQALGPRLRDSQTFAFDKWAQEYRGDLGIAVADTYGTDAFLRDFDMYFCKLFDGARHDSGDPFNWGERLIAHYRKNRVDPRTKTLIFSDQLTVPIAIEIARRFHGRALTAFGIGTNLTNDLGHEPINIVIKMTECNASRWRRSPTRRARR